jgi:hypothetical protein
MLLRILFYMYTIRSATDCLYDDIMFQRRATGRPTTSAKLTITIRIHNIIILDTCITRMYVYRVHYIHMALALRYRLRNMPMINVRWIYERTDTVFYAYWNVKF